MDLKMNAAESEEIRRRKEYAERKVRERHAMLKKEAEERRKKTMEHRERVESVLKREQEMLQKRMQKLNEDEERKRATLAKQHEATSRMANITKSPKSFAFGSSTPRTLAYLDNLPKSEQLYDKKLKPIGNGSTSISPASSSPQSRNGRSSNRPWIHSPVNKSTNNMNMTMSMYAPGSSSAPSTRNRPVRPTENKVSRRTPGPQIPSAMTQSVYTPSKPQPLSINRTPTSRAPRTSMGTTPNANKRLTKPPMQKKTASSDVVKSAEIRKQGSKMQNVSKKMEEKKPTLVEKVEEKAENEVEKPKENVKETVEKVEEKIVEKTNETTENNINSTVDDIEEKPEEVTNNIEEPLEKIVETVEPTVDAANYVEEVKTEVKTEEDKIDQVVECSEVIPVDTKEEKESAEETVTVNEEAEKVVFDLHIKQDLDQLPLENRPIEYEPSYKEQSDDVEEEGEHGAEEAPVINKDDIQELVYPHNDSLSRENDVQVESATQEKTGADSADDDDDDDYKKETSIGAPVEPQNNRDLVDVFGNDFIGSRNEHENTYATADEEADSGKASPTSSESSSTTNEVTPRTVVIEQKKTAQEIERDERKARLAELLAKSRKSYMPTTTTQLPGSVVTNDSPATPTSPKLSEERSIESGASEMKERCESAHQEALEDSAPTRNETGNGPNDILAKLAASKNLTSLQKLLQRKQGSNPSLQTTESTGGEIYP